MNHKDGSNEHEQMMESFYRYIGYQHIKNVGKEFDEISELAKDIEYPKELDSWFNNYLEKSKKAEMRNKRIIFIKRLAKRVAMVTLVLGIGLTVMTFSVDAFRIKFLNLVTDVTQRYTSFQVVEIEDHEAINIPADWNNYYLLDYVTNGYSFNRIQEFGENKIVFYQNSQGDEIQFSQFPNNNSFQVDTEKAVTTEIIINGNKGTLVEKKGLLTLIWYNANQAFYLMGNIDKEEIVKMAESSKVKDE